LKDLIHASKAASLIFAVFLASFAILNVFPHFSQDFQLKKPFIFLLIIDSASAKDIFQDFNASKQFSAHFSPPKIVLVCINSGDQ
jgi:hypothetical protein